MQPAIKAATGGPSTRLRRRRLARRGRWTIAIAALVLVFAGLAVWAHEAGGWLNLLSMGAGRVVGGVVQPGKPSTPVVPVAPKTPISVLLLGTEQAPDYAGPDLTDTIMLLQYDPIADKTSVLSIPRDLYVTIPGYGQNRINTAYENGGPALAARVVEATTGVPVEYYAVVNYAALVKLVDAVGGVDVVVPPGVTGKGIHDTCYPNANEDACTLFDLPAGPAHLDGATALKFSRERHSFADGDIQREKDQQQVITALQSQLLQPQNLLKIPAILTALSGLVQTNIPSGQWLRLATEAHGAPITSAVLEYESGAISNQTIDGADVLVPDLPTVHQAAAGLFGAVLQPLAGQVVQVENGAPTNQPLATEFSDILQGMGADPLPAETAATTTETANHVYVNTAVVPAGQAPPAAAAELGQMLGTTVEQQAFAGSTAPIVVILGSAYMGH